MPEKLPYIQFYPGDWLRDSVSGCSLAAQGLWLRMMIVAHDSDRYGYLEVNGSPMQPETIARRCGCDLAQYETLLSELASAGVPGTSSNRTLYSRRMARDATLRETRANAGRKGGKQTAKQKRSKAQAKQQQNPEVENDNDNESAIVLNLPEILNNQPFRDALAKWLSYKRERREGYKPSGMAAVVSAAASRAKSFGLAAVIQAMETARANNWQGWDQKSAFGGGNGQQQSRVTSGQRYRDPSAT